MTIDLFAGVALRIADHSTGGEEFPTKHLQKGFLLLNQDQVLAEEGVGFGVPVLKQGILTIFPGAMDLACQKVGSAWEVTSIFEMNLVERLARPGLGNLKSRPLYTAKNSLAALHRRLPLVRGLLTATSSGLRRVLGWETTFEKTGLRATLKLTHTIHGAEGNVHVAVDLTDVPRDTVTEVVVMNEQGARHFDRYRDSEGAALRGKEIGAWDQVGAEEASFLSSVHRLAFSLRQVKEARLYRGRELVGSRLAWAGFGYSVAPTTRGFGYDLRIKRLS